YVTSVVELYLVWALLGIAMAATLYEPAFAVLVQLFRRSFRRAITALTLFGGFASTVFWPLTATLMERYGWRDTALVLGVVNLVICVPLHVVGLPARRTLAASKSQHVPSRSIGEVLGDRTFYLL